MQSVALANSADVVFSGPLLFAALISIAAGLVSFFSPCCLPLVPGFLAMTAGTAGAEVHASRVAAVDTRVSVRRTVTGAALFIGGFASVFVAFGAAFGGLGALLGDHQDAVIRVLGVVTIALGLAFMGVLSSVPILQRTVRVNYRPRLGTAGPLRDTSVVSLGDLFKAHGSNKTTLVEVPGSVAAMLLLPIPVAHPPNKKNPAHRPDYFLWWRCLKSNTPEFIGENRSFRSNSYYFSYYLAF